MTDEQAWTVLILALIGLVIWKVIPPRVKGALILCASLMLAAGLFSYGLANAYGTGTGVRGHPKSVTPAGFSGGRQANANRELGWRMAAGKGWTGSQWNALDRLVQSESGWRNTAQNPHSTAYGIGQFLDKTWAHYGYSKTSDPRTQIAAMLKYIKARYRTPEAAWAFKQRHNWY